MGEDAKRKLYEIVGQELEDEKSRFYSFRSGYEAYAALLEKKEGMTEELETLECFIRSYWSGVKESVGENVMNEELTDIYRTAIVLAEKALEAAAVARMGITSSIGIWSAARNEAKERQEKA